jgi:tripartite-type tricarboxylate transporter receptor subunit TctC
MIDFLPSSIEHIRAGKLRALGVASNKRWADLPDVPAVGEFLPGFEGGLVFGIIGPKDTPNEAIGRLNRGTNAALADSGIRARFAEIGGEVLIGSPLEFAKRVEADAEKWGRVIRTAGIKAE